MTEIQQNRWDRLIRRSAGVVGGGSQVNDTLNELFPIMDVENVPAELLALMQTQMGFCSSRLSPSVAESNHHQLFNPAGSNALITVTTVGMYCITGSEFGFSNFIAALTTLAGNERRRDTRAGTLASIVAQQRTDQSAVGAGQDFRVVALANDQVLVSDQNAIAVLFPGTGLTITTISTNVNSVVSFMWRERTFEPSEQVD